MNKMYVRETTKHFTNCLFCSKPFKEEDAKFDSVAFVNSICAECNKKTKKGKTSLFTDSI